MSTCKISLICTFKNEASSIEDFLKSLTLQSRAPDEVIMVDGGSKGGTIDMINSYGANNTAFPIKVIICEGANIAQGRNIAVKNASFDVIAVTDLGCTLDKDWLKNIVKPFEEGLEVDVVSGWTEPDARTRFEKIAADVVFLKLSVVTKNQDKFLPPGRSVAFKKACWESVGGYPEWLYTAEDTLYAINLKKAGYRFYFASTAVIYWRVRPNLKGIFKQHFLYAKGDAHAGTNTKSHVILTGGFIIAIILSICSLYHAIFLIGSFMMFCFYCGFWFWKKSINFHEAPLSKLFIQLAVDISGVIGFISGRMARYYKSN